MQELIQSGPATFQPSMISIYQNMSTSCLPTTFDGWFKLADILATSDFCPKQYKGQSANVFLAINFGMALGLNPFQSLEDIAVINGRRCVWGDMALSLVRIHPEFCDIEEWREGDTAFCKITRKGQTPCVRSFSIVDAQKAGLWKKVGPWTQYPDRMLQMRARAWCMRDTFSDALKGVSIAEEAQDIPPNSVKEAFEPKVIIPAKEITKTDWLAKSKELIDSATTLEQLKEVGPKIKAFKLAPDDAAAARDAYALKQIELSDALTIEPETIEVQSSSVEQFNKEWDEGDSHDSTI